MSEKEMANDIVWGIKGVAEVLNLNERKAHYLIATGRVPVRRFGRRLAASRSALLRLFEESE